MYPWPTGDFGSARDVALDTAMNYLEHTGQAENFVDVQRVGHCDFSGLGCGWRSTGVHCQPRKNCDVWSRGGDHSATATVGRHHPQGSRQRRAPRPAAGEGIKPTVIAALRCPPAHQHPLQMFFIFASTFGSSARISASPDIDGPGVTVPSIRPAFPA